MSEIAPLIPATLVYLFGWLMLMFLIKIILTDKNYWPKNRKLKIVLFLTVAILQPVIWAAIVMGLLVGLVLYVMTDVIEL